MLLGRKQCDEIVGCGTIFKSTLDYCPKCGNPEEFSDFLPFNPLDWIYDLETYPNIFTADLKHVASGHRMLFEISDRIDQSVEFYGFLMSLRGAGCRMIGFNNLGFDYPIIHFFINYFHGGISVGDLYGKVQELINTPWNNRYDNVIWDDDVLIPQIDLFKIHHFDNQTRSTSLKMIEFNLCMDSIQDLPFPPGTILDDVKKDVLISYNDHDIDATELFYIESLEMIEFREQLSEKHNRNFLNHSDKKIGTDLFVAELEANQPGCCYHYPNGKREKRQTFRDSINFSEIIFPYINFKIPQFNLIKDWLSSQVITKTKGAFEYINVTPEMAFYMNPDIIKVHGLTTSDVDIDEKKLKKGVWLSECKDQLYKRDDLHRFKFISGLKDKSGLNCVVNGFKYDFGTGGIHGSIDSAIVESDDEFIIKDWDVGGYYPEVGNKNNLFPEHLSNEFCNVDRRLATERKKHKKGTALNRSIKLSRNGAYGDSNNIYSPLYDPKYTMSITINGQLMLCMLAQYLLDIPGLTMIQINTDGLTVRCPRKYEEAMNKICKWWDEYTCLELESVVYSRMFISNVNNYIGEYENGKLKRKGAYAHVRIMDDPNTAEREWHQNHSSLVVPKAAEAALVHGQDIGDFIRNHDNIFDFMLRTKVGGSDKLVLTDSKGIDHPQQKITRYYISNSPNAGELVKIAPPAKGHAVGSWKRATKLTDEFYSAVVKELRELNPAYTVLGGGELDSDGLPWDVRINTKNRSVYKIRRTDLNAGFNSIPCNEINNVNRSDINFDYYIAETEKLVNPLRG